MIIKKFHRAAKQISFTVENPSDQGEEEVTKKCPEAPVQECDDALQKLTDVVISIMELPLSWAGKPDAPTLVPTGFNLSHTNAGTRSIEISYIKAFRCGKKKAYTTPMVQIDDPAEGESEESALADGERVTCNQAIEQATLYIGGHRLQQNLQGIQIGRPEDPNQESIEFKDTDPEE